MSIEQYEKQPVKARRTQLDRNVERRRELCERVNAIWFEAYRQGQTHAWIMQQIDARVYQTERYKKLPAWAKQSVTDAGFTMLCAAQGWMLGNVWIWDGIAYANKWDQLPEDIKSMIRADQLKLVTVWAEYSQRFVDRPADQVKLFSA